MACTPKPIRKHNKVFTALMRRHQRRNPKSVVILLDENWTMFNGYRNALVKRMGRESRSSVDYQPYRPALAPVFQRLTDLPQEVVESMGEKGNS